MSPDITITKYSEVHIKVTAEPSITRELRDYFTFKVPGYQFMPAYKNRLWDGNIALYQPLTGLIYAGLLPRILHFAAEREYSVNNLVPTLPQLTPEQSVEFCKSLEAKFADRDYQLAATHRAINSDRQLFLAATNAGKSKILYNISRYVTEVENGRVLIVVPTTTLVGQMSKDFLDYNNDQELDVYGIMGGVPKETNSKIVISTWQSLFKLKKDWFNQFDCVMIDEAHGAKSKSLTGILEKCERATRRFGFTGTLDGTETHQLVLEGLLGPVMTVVTTTELIEKGYSAQLKINILIFKYADAIRKMMAQADYASEVDYLVQHPSRNDAIVKLARSLKGNTLILFNYVDKHGKPLFEELHKQISDHSRLHYVSGETKTDNREAVRQLVDQSDNAIVTASYATFSTGINIKNINNIILASPTKSRIRLLQSIGRMLRVSEKKDRATLYDLADDLEWKSWRNFGLRHLMERIEIYNDSEFTYRINNFQLNS